MKTVVKIGLLCIYFIAARSAWSGIVYTTLPDPLLPDEFSVGYEDTQAAEFGALIQLSGAGPFTLDSARIAMSNWGVESSFEPVGTSSGFTLPLTLNLYAVGPGNTVGDRIDSVTTMEFIPWRPEADPADCGAGSTDYLASDGSCYPGAISIVSFNLNGIATPSVLIYGLAFNTQDFGAAPYHAPGPYDALHLAMSGAPPDAGANPLPNTAYWNTSYGPNYADAGAAGVGVFRQDQGWDPFSAAIAFDATATPEPATPSLIALSLVGMALTRIRRRFTKQ